MYELKPLLILSEVRSNWKVVHNFLKPKKQSL